mmetsp:Transcript_68645/g.147032  ORF Transcript_68645/g.147032 Transcript_68645/m.147032 type:complete len:331 (-) Transcript_68645:52-1044(-)
MAALQRWMLATLIALTASIALAKEKAKEEVRLETIDDLVGQYTNIFKTENRNAASHLWSSFLLARAGSLPAATVSRLFKGFCAVSGSPLPDDPHTRYPVTLPKVGGGTETGIVRYCCWPCICDTVELIWVDTKTVHTADGPREFRFLVVGDPCTHPEKLEDKFTDSFSGFEMSLREAAPEVKCNGGRLLGANFSDHGHPIIGMLSPGEDEDPDLPKSGHHADDPTFGYKKWCQERRKDGYNSGMGLIFHLVGKIAPIGGPVVEEKFSPVHITPEVTGGFHKTLGLAAMAVMLSAATSGFAIVGLRRCSRGRAKVECSSDEEGQAVEAPTE